MSVSYFIIGAGRSGTSLLASMVDAHPQLTCGMEVATVHCLSGQVVRDSTSVSARLKCLERACLDEAKLNVGVWGNKLTTEQIAFLDELTPAEPAFFTQFSSQKIIYVLRDGRACVQSKINRKGKSVHDAIISWRRSLHMLDWLREHAAERTLEVRFEDLLLSPEDILTSVSQFLGVAYSPKMLEGTTNPIMPAIYRDVKGLQAEKAAPPPHQSWHAMINDDLKRYGYL